MLLFGILLGQDAPLVSRIEIVGNEVTAEDVIRREIYHNINVPFDSVTAREDVTRLLNLGIFNQAVYRTYPQPDGSLTLTYMVVEAWRVLPTLAPVYYEETGWSLIMGLAIKNFRGRNQFINVNASWGGLAAYGFAYYDPWISGDHLSVQIDARRNEFQHLYFPTRVRDEYVNILFGRYFGDEKKMKIGGRLARRNYQASEDTQYEYWSPFFQIQHDTRDLYSNPRQGCLLQILIEGTYGLSGQPVHFTRFVPSLSGYYSNETSQQPWILAGNVSLGFFPGDVPEYFQSYFGGSYTIRGWPLPDEETYSDPKQAFRFGTHFWMSSLELRKNIIPKFIPTPGLEFALDLGLFIDVGAIGTTPDQLAGQRPMVGLGGGLRVPMTGFESLRFDYGFGFYNGRYAGRAFHLAYGLKF